MTSSNIADVAQPGDLLFYPSCGYPWDLAIQLVSPKFTHVALVYGVGNSRITTIDANMWRGVDLDMYPKLYKGCKLMRLTYYTESEHNAVLAYARGKIGAHYNVFGALKAGLLRKIGLTEMVDDSRVFEHCSEFVINCERAAHPFLFQFLASQTILPDDLLRLPGLKEVWSYAS